MSSDSQTAPQSVTYRFGDSETQQYINIDATSEAEARTQLPEDREWDLLDRGLSTEHAQRLAEYGLTTETVQSIGFYTDAAGYLQVPADQYTGAAYVGPASLRVTNPTAPLLLVDNVPRWAVVTQVARDAGEPLAVIAHPHVHLRDPEHRAPWLQGEALAVKGRVVYVLYTSVTTDMWAALAEARVVETLSQAGADVRRCRFPRGVVDARWLTANSETDGPAQRLRNVLSGAFGDDYIKELFDGETAAAEVVERFADKDVAVGLYLMDEVARDALLMRVRGSKGPAEKMLKGLSQELARTTPQAPKTDPARTLTNGIDQVSVQADKIRVWATTQDWYHATRGVAALQRDSTGRLQIETLQTQTAGARVAEAFTLMTLGTGEHAEVRPAAQLPSAAVNVVLAQPTRFRPLLAIADAPFFRPDGSIVYDAGYDASTATYLDPLLEMPPVAEAPTDREGAHAVEVIEDLINEADFADDASRASWWAMLFYAVAREVVGGPVPALVIRSDDDRGAGKTLMTQLIKIIAHGTDDLSTLRAHEELAKKFFAKILRDPTAPVIFDNVERPISSAELSAFLTGERYADRILKESTEVTVPNKTVLMFSINGGSVDEDIATRSIYTNLRVRPGYRYKKDPLAYAKAHRGELRWAVMTIVRWWISQGRPEGAAYGDLRFPAARDFAAGLLQAAGVPGWLDGRGEEMLNQQLSDDIPSELLAVLRRGLPTQTFKLVEGRKAYRLVDLLHYWRQRAQNDSGLVGPPRIHSEVVWCRDKMRPLLLAHGWTLGPKRREGRYYVSPRDWV